MFPPQGDAIELTNSCQSIIGLRVPEELISAARVGAHRAGRANEDIERIATSGQVYVSIAVIDPGAIHIILRTGT